MTQLWEVCRFELGYQASRASTRLYFALFLGLTLAMSWAILLDARDDGYFFNAPVVTSLITIVASMFSLLVVSGVAGDAATRDLQLRLDPLLYTTPLRKAAYLGGRFLGAFTVTSLLLLAVPAALLLAASVPGLEPGVLGPFRLQAYLTSFFLFALPNAFVATAVLFALAVLSRRAITAYAGAVVLFFAAFIANGFIGGTLGRWDLAKLADPLGYTALHALWTSYNPLQKNVLLVGLEPGLVANRLLWPGVAAGVLALAYARFRFAHHAGGGWARGATADDVPAVRWTGITMPAARPSFSFSTRMRQLLAIAAVSFRELVTGKGWLIVPAVALLFVITAPEILELELGTPGAATTARVADILAAGEMARLIAILIAISLGELVWRERDARMHAIADATPVPEWVSCLGKFLALALMLVFTELIFLMACVTVQAMLGGIDATQSIADFEPLLYVKILFGFQLTGYLLFAALAMAIHVLVNQKYVANALAVLAYVATQLAREVGLEHNLLIYGGAPEWTYSQMSGFGLQIGPWLWFTFYWSGWALLFAVVAYLFWIRGEERGLRPRLALARRRMTRGPAAVGALAVAVMAGAGGYVFYNTNVLHRYRTAAELERRSAEYERRYGRYASLPQPTLAATKLQVDFYPRRAAATIRGSYRLENRSGAAVDRIHVLPYLGVKTEDVSFDRPSRATHTDDDLGYRIYTLARPLQPGESVRMRFRLEYAPRGFTNRGRNPSVVPNGSWIQHRASQSHSQRQWLPFVGYQKSGELDDPAARKRHGLPGRAGVPSLYDAAARNARQGVEKIELETIVGTDAGQTGVAPGALRRTWTEHGRRYFHYVTDAPVSNSYAIYSARYAVRRTRWKDVDVEIFHHPAHTANLQRMLHGATASLESFTRSYSPYPHRQLRLVEYPSSGSGLGLTSFPGLVEYSEGLALVRVEDDPRKIDFPFAVIGHEMGHQWWGHQLVPAQVEGGALLSESLAWYSSMTMVEKTLGREHLLRLLAVMRAEFMDPQETRQVPLLRTSDHFGGYRTGPFAMHALREAVGEERVNRALRNLLGKFDPAKPPYPTSLDLYAELRSVTPPSMHYLLKDLFEEITFWDLRTRKVDVQPAGRGTYRVALQVEAQKLKGNALGKEQPVPMNDAIDVALFDAAGKPLYRRQHRLRSGPQTITLTVPHPPASAALDPDHALLDRKPGDNAMKVGT